MGFGVGGRSGEGASNVSQKKDFGEIKKSAHQPSCQEKTEKVEDTPGQRFLTSPRKEGDVSGNDSDRSVLFPPDRGR